MKVYNNIRKMLSRSGGHEKLLLLLLVFCGPVVLAQDLTSYIEEAEQNNPLIKSYELRYELATEKINEVGALPDTEISGGYFLSEPETRTGPQRTRFSLRQMIPWFGTITARKNYSSAMADAEFMEVAIAKRNLALSVAQSYYTLYSIQAKQEVLIENIRLLGIYHELALNKVEVGKASAVDVLKLQIRQNELAKENMVLGQEFQAETVKFNNLLNRNEKAAVLLVDSLALPAEKSLAGLEVTQLHPELLKYEQLYESVVELEKLNQKESLPKLGFGLDYVAVSERTDMMMEDNGKDILMPMISISIPIFSNKYQSVSRQNQIREKEIQTQRDERLNKLETMLATAIGSRSSARITVKSLLENLEKTENVEEIITRSYETGIIDFRDLLDVQELRLKFETGIIEAVKNYYMQSAVINYLTI